MKAPAIRRPVLVLAAIFAMAGTQFPAAGDARATVACSEQACDEQQIGPYVAPDIEIPNLEDRFDPRGKPVTIPGIDASVRHRPGSGVWLGEVPGNANLFLKPSREGVAIDMKLDF